MALLIENKIHVIVVAAGVGSRFAANTTSAKNAIQLKPKQYQMLGQKTVLAHSICAFNAADISGITVVLSSTDQHWDQQPPINSKHTVKITTGGAQRQDSVRNGIKAISAEPQDWVLVHDAARPCVSLQEIQDLIEACLTKQQGGLLVKPINDTIKYSQDGEIVKNSVDRNQLYAALTPQMFRCGELLKALTVYEAGSITDESSALEAQGHHPIMVTSKNTNIKITSFEDLAIAEAILKQQGRL